jgi:mannose-6-phosphate isomerase-like protein (cupin superfamily)
MSKAKWVLGHRVTPIETLGDFGMLHIVTGSGVPGPPPHHHEDASEFFYILDGALEVMQNGQWARIGAGESANVPRGVVHTFRNPLETPCEWLTAFSPRGFERFFQEFGVPVGQSDALEVSTSDAMIGRVIAECAEYGMILDPSAM